MMVQVMQKPDWATNYNYLWHSNPQSQPTCKTFFNKCYIRPQVNAAWKVVKDSSQSIEASQSAWKTINKFKDDNANMLAGRTVQTFCDDVLLNDSTAADALVAAQATLSVYKPRQWDDSDRSKYERRVDELELVADSALNGLREALRGVNAIEGEREVWTEIPRCELPFFGKPDYIGRVELKTKWDRPARSKSGWAQNSLPTKPTYPHLTQVAGYWAGTGLPQTLVYANKADFRIFTPENCEELQPDNLKRVWGAAARDCRIREGLLQAAHALGGDIRDLMRLVPPQFAHPFAWDVAPEVKAIALELWDE